ncbi:hypothetical protein LP087_13695 (plasmid) [Moraxella bovis]|uniref:hypothetical protein n=1 Tax=Moraxella bovis TaxID=476 RepID=UPI00222705EF|nr:hypothetical protein [Moraxella bovis]UZA34049.1 hypothetical protein LP087_13695 [Moraxella bovis]UZA49966.1 hypothetical protein LP100_14095 [Moraxella bovis]
MCNTPKTEHLYSILKAGNIESFNPQLSSTQFFAEKQKETDSIVNALAKHITKTLQFIQNSNPKNLQKFSWLDRFLGKQVEAKMLFEIAKSELYLSQKDGEILYNKTKAIKDEQSFLVQSLENDLVEVSLYIDVINQFLAENQDLSMQDGYVDNKQRLDRKLESLLAMKINLSMNIEQAKLSILPITQVLDRYQETISAVSAYKKYLGQYYSNSESQALKELEMHYNLIFGAKQ